MNKVDRWSLEYAWEGPELIKSGMDLQIDGDYVLYSDYAKLEEEVKELRKDAGRYKWLRDIGNSTWMPLSKRFFGGTYMVDEEIDATMKKGGEDE